jgi:allantoicase
MIDLLSQAAGGRVVGCNDEFFAPAENLLRNPDPVWRDGEYTDRGKWMDGWETRRRREPGHDWCVLALGIPGRVRRVAVDTSHFTGNYPEEFSLEATGSGSDDRLAGAAWELLIPPTKLSGDSVASFEVDDPHRVTHLRLNIFPDGGVARLRVEGEPLPSIREVCPGGPVDLVSAAVGGVAVSVSDRHYSDPANTLRPTAPAGMWDGWETRRRRGPGHDWAVFRLGLSGTIDEVVVDTTHFKGNAPGSVSLDVSDDGETWTAVIAGASVRPDASNRIRLSDPTPATLVRLGIHPDGGVARFRVLGRAAPTSAGETRVLYLNSLFEDEALRFFSAACSVPAWVGQMTSGRPYGEVDEVLAAAEQAFDSLDEQAWLDAFASHPRIGEKGDDTSAREQSGVAGAGRAVLRELAEVNTRYEEKHGFTYIVHASGKSASEMLEIAKSRLENSRPDELVIAAAEQRSITETRLRRMLCQELS